MIDTAVILAAGRGSRLKDKTLNKPKGFLIIDGMPVVEQSICRLLSVNIEKIFIGTGYLSNFYEELMNKYPVMCVENKKYDITGSMYTLYNMRDYICNDFLLLESDLIYDKIGLNILIEDKHKDIILSSGKTDSGDEVYIEADTDNNLVNMSKNPCDLKCIYAELTGINKISIETFREMCDFAEVVFDRNLKLDYEYSLTGIAHKKAIYVKKIDPYIWCEIDDEYQLNRAINFIYPEIKRRESCDG
jgi:2-aminoethylphosphonate-pyruvate transaminase